MPKMAKPVVHCALRSFSPKEQESLVELLLCFAGYRIVFKFGTSSKDLILLHSGNLNLNMDLVEIK